MNELIDSENNGLKILLSYRVDIRIHLYLRF